LFPIFQESGIGRFSFLILTAGIVFADSSIIYFKKVFYQSAAQENVDAHQKFGYITAVKIKKFNLWKEAGERQKLQ
jgi:ABC-type molybdate transport system ATPase subunit